MNTERFMQRHPDEPAGGAKLPDKVAIDGVGEVSFAELVNSFKFSRANHERAEELKRGQERLQADRASWEQQRVESQKERQGFLEVIERVAAPRPETPPPARFDLAEALSKVEIVADENASEKLGQLIDLAFEQRDQELQQRDQESQQRFQGEIAKLNQSYEQRLAQELQSLRSEKTRETAAQAAERANEEMFQRTLKARLGEEAFRALSESELSAVRKTARSQYSDDTGTFDAANQWRWKAEAVERALWAAEPTRRVLLNRAQAEARVDGLGHRIAMESASASTPGRQPRSSTVNLDEALKSKMDNLRTLLAQNRITPVQAQAMMGEDAPKILSYYQAKARGEGG